MGCSSLRTAPVWALPMGCSPSGTGCSSVGPHGVTSPASKPALVWASFSRGPQVLTGACSSTGSPWGHSFLQASTCSGVGVPSIGYRWIAAPPWTSMDCRGTTCLTIVFHHELQGKALCSGILSTSSPLLH